MRVHKIKDLETLGSIISELSTRWSQWIKIIRTPNRPLDTSNFTNKENETNESRTSNKRNLWHTPRRNTSRCKYTRLAKCASTESKISKLLARLSWNSELDYLGTLDSIISMDQNHQNPKPTSGHFQLHESRTSNKGNANIKQTKPLAHPATKHEHQTNERQGSRSKNQILNRNISRFQ